MKEGPFRYMMCFGDYRVGSTLRVVFIQGQLYVYHDPPRHKHVVNTADQYLFRVKETHTAMSMHRKQAIKSLPNTQTPQQYEADSTSSNKDRLPD